MLVSLIKFIHLLCIIGLLGATFVCILLAGSRKFSWIPSTSQDLMTRLNTSLLFTSVIAMGTGTFLVLPRHFTFHTAWIQAAYLLVTLYCVGIATLMLLRKKRITSIEGEKISSPKQWAWRIAYAVLLIILIAVVHDAVTKTTFII